MPFSEETFRFFCYAEISKTDDPQVKSTNNEDLAVTHFNKILSINADQLDNQHIRAWELVGVQFQMN